MERFIPYQKLSKRERRARDAARRAVWDISPVTRRPENPRAYKREKTRKSIRDALNVSFLFPPRRGKEIQASGHLSLFSIPSL